MIFSNLEFFGFFAAFLPFYVLTFRRIGLRNALILLASYIFYGWWDTRFLALIAVSTAMDYVAGLAIAGERKRWDAVAKACGLVLVTAAAIVVLEPKSRLLVAGMSAGFCVLLVGLVAALDNLPDWRRRRLFLAASVITNLGMLGAFKYFNFFAESFADFAALFGWTPGFVTLNVVLPVGISFYTFQTMSYTLDIYRNRLEPTSKIVSFAAFVSFFPQLVAGPIERAQNLLPQFFERRDITWDGVKSGAILFLWGFYKKAVIADNLAPISDQVFSNPQAFSPDQILAGVLAFTFQIYCDFSGYSDMARGVARIMGFELMLNFNMPYFSRTPSEFWRRWHISLSSWLRDYLYVPLGGNRYGSFATYRNLMLTMLLGGLWHGAAWTFVAWGFYHGVILVIYRLARIDGLLERIPVRSAIGLPMHLGAAAIMFVLAVYSWVFFRAEGFGDAFYILGHMYGFSIEAFRGVAFYVLPLIALDLGARLTDRINVWDRAPWYVVYNVVLFLLYAALLLSAARGQDFIYFDF